MKTDRDFLRGCLSFAMAGLLGVETAADTTQKIKEVHAMLDPLGPWGSLAATATSAVLLAANHAYRNKTRKKALGK